MESEIDRLRKKVENFPSPSSYNRLAELLHLAKADAEAEAVCRKCIKEFPRNSQVFALMADINLAQGKRQDATTNLRAALERDGRNYAAHRMLADLLIENRDIAGAAAQLKQVLAFRPGDPAVTKRLGELESLLRGLPSGAMPARSATPPVPMRPVSAAAPASTAPAPTTPVPPRPASPPPASAPIPMPAAASTPTPRPAASAPAGGASGVRATPGSGVRRSAFDALAGEAGVKGAVVVDQQGQVVVARGVDGGRDESLAAFGAALAISVAEVAKVAGYPAPSSWLLGAEQGQVLAFHRDNGFSVVALADTSVRPAMLELRARQALIDLGAT